VTEQTPNSSMLEVGELTEAEAYQLAEALKLQLADHLRPNSDDDSLRRMVAGLGDQRGSLRLTFAQSLGSVGEAAVPILCHALKNNPNVVIRRASAKTLNIIGSELALPNLIEAFETDDDPVVQGSSAGAMATIGIPAIESIFKILSDKKCTAFQVGLINLALSFIGAKAPDAFNTAAKSGNPEIRIAALTALSEQVQSGSSRSARNLLLEALEDEEEEVRAEAATITGKTLDPEDAEDQLIILLQDTSPQVRKNTALALMKMEACHSIEPLMTAIKSEPDNQVKAVMEVAHNQLKRIS
jgi:bilin biosynthesis protein